MDGWFRKRMASGYRRKGVRGKAATAIAKNTPKGKAIFSSFTAKWMPVQKRNDECLKKICESNFMAHDWMYVCCVTFYVIRNDMYERVM